MDFLIMYPVIWAIFMALGAVGYLATRKTGAGYLIFQVVFISLVLVFLPDTFGATDPLFWQGYAIGFGAYFTAFMIGAAANKIDYAIAFQVIAFAVTYIVLPWHLGVA